MAEDGSVSTIFVAGLPVDAGARELENMMRFMPGYEGVKISGKGGGKGGSACFVKFDSKDNANGAMYLLNEKPFDLQYADQVMRVELARSDMKPAAPGAPRREAYPPVQQAAYGQPQLAGFPQMAPQMYPGQPGGAPAKRPRTGEDPSAVDTIAIFGAIEKGFTEQQLEDYFSQLDGYVMFKSNTKVGGGFVKFRTPLQAQGALEAALQSGLEAHVARTSMSNPAGEQPAAFGAHGGYEVPHTPAYGAAPGYGGGKGAPKGGGGQGIDTLILQGVVEKGWTAESITEMFQKSAAGFLIFKANPRVGGGFAKFVDAYHATAAIAVASAVGIEAQMARSSMSTN